MNAIITANDTPSGGPREVIEKHNSTLTLLGTAHVSKASADEVADLIRSGEFDAIAIELCESRFRAMQQPDQVAKMDLYQVIREGKAGMVMASLALGAFQQRVAEESGIAPGAEMKAAIDEANKANLPLLLIDRELGITLKRVYKNVPWWQRMNLFSGLLASMLSREKVTSEDIEKLKQGDVLESTFAEFAQESESLYEPLIRERDHYMALRLIEEQAKSPFRHVLVVIGAGHLKGMTENLQGHWVENPREQRQLLEQIPPSSRWPKLIPWIILILVLSGFILGFSRNTELGIQLILDWFLINGTLAALGSLLAAGHPLTIIGSFFAAPFTSLNPTIGAGMVAAAIELSLRKPTVGDFSRLRQDVVNMKGWWKNRVSRTLLVFMFATLGSAAGTYIAGFKIFGQLAAGG